MILVEEKPFTLTQQELLTLSKLNILLTGASSGIGLTLYNKFRERGHKVYRVGKDGPDFYCDFRSINEISVKQIWREATTFFQAPIDCLINNAGITAIDFIENADVYDFDNIIACNLKAPWLFSREMVKQCIKEQGENIRRIISTSSMGASIGLRASIPYCASKAALEAMTRSLAKETAGRMPLIVCAIAPSGIEYTAMQAQVEVEMVSKRGFTPEGASIYFNAGTPLGRKGTHEEIWSVFQFAVESMPAIMTGSILHCPQGVGI